MAKVSIIAKLTTAEENVAAFEDALATMVTASDEEPGLEIYSVHKDPDTAGVYWFFELYTDDAAVAAHGTSDAMKAAMAATGACLAAPPEIHRLTPVVAKGLDL